VQKEEKQKTRTNFLNLRKLPGSNRREKKNHSEKLPGRKGISRERYGKREQARDEEESKETIISNQGT